MSAFKYFPSEECVLYLPAHQYIRTGIHRYTRVEKLMRLVAILEKNVKFQNKTH